MLLEFDLDSPDLTICANDDTIEVYPCIPDFTEIACGYILKIKGVDCRKIIDHAGYNCIKYYFNTLAFDAAYDQLVTYCVFLNPYYVVESIPIPPILETMACPAHKLGDGRSTPINEAWDAYAHPITPDDLQAWETLPNGWDTLSGEDTQYLGIKGLSYPYYRPSPSSPIRGIVAAKTVLLHPSLPRPMTADELAKTQQHNFTAWFNSVLHTWRYDMGIQGPWSVEHNLILTHTPNKMREIIPPTFRWHESISKLKRIRKFLGASNE